MPVRVCCIHVFIADYLHYYLKERGTIAYRGLEMAQSGRMLTLFAQYYRYTRDSATLLRYFDKIQGIIMLLRGRRAQTAASPGPLKGMPIGHDEADLFVTWAEENPSGNHSTELPFYSIAAEFWRGGTSGLCSATSVSLFRSLNALSTLV
jgi:hypothetical protein